MDDSGVQASRGGWITSAAPPGWTAFVCAALILLTLVAFGPAFSGEWLSWDDAQNFVLNDRWRGLSAAHLRWMLTTFLLGHYQPVTWFTFGAQYGLSGMEPRAYHGFNILVHGLNGVLLFFVARRVLALAPPREGAGGASKLVTVAAAIAAVLFVAHPLRVETVAWITERRDVLSTAFLLGATLAYFKGVRMGGPGLASKGWYLTSLLLCVLSCGSKAWGMSFFLVLIALDMVPLQRITSLRAWFTRDGIRIAAEKVPFAVIGLATAVLASRAQAVAYAAKPLEEYGVVNRLVQASYGLWFYVKQTIAPSVHSPLYEIPADLDPLAPRFVLTYLFVALLAVICIWCWKRARGVSVAIALYVLLISPVLGILQSGDQFVADRYSYLATIPLTVLAGGGIVWLIRWLEQNKPERARTAEVAVSGLALVATGAMVVASRAQTRVWHDSRTLWTYAAQVTPTAFVLCNWAEHFKQEDPAKAREICRQATEDFPRSGRAWWDYGSLSRDAGDYAEAERAFGESAKYLTPTWPSYQELGLMYRNMGRLEAARAALERAVADNTRPEQWRSRGMPHLNLARVQLELGDREAAVANLKRAMEHRDAKNEAEALLRQLSGQ